MAEANKSSIGVRVRPNADGFIRNLRAELASKKYTFYVDVRARTNYATEDVRVWARTTLKNVEAKVNVGASTVKATGDVAAWRRRQREIETVIPVRANLAPASRDVEVWRAAAGRDLEIKVKANVSGRLSEIERVRKVAEKDARMIVRGDTSKIKGDIKSGLDAAQGQLFSVEVDANTKKAKYQIGELFNEVKGEQLEMDLDVDTTGAHAKLQEVKTAAKELSPTAKVHLETAEYRRDMAKLKLDAMRKKLTVDVEAKVTKGANFNKQLNNLEKMFGNATIIRSMDLGPINLGKPTGLVGTMTTITALAGLVPTLVTGLSALSDGFIRLAGAASMAPGILAAFGASMGTAAVASFGFTDALDALFKVWTEPTDKIERNQRNTIKWTNDLNKALTNEKQAQRAVADARRDATNELRNLNNELRGSVLNEAQAILDLQRAKDRLAQGDFENATEQTQAQLDVAKAYQNVIDVRERNTQLNQKAAQQNQRGVEESDQVIAALDQQARAIEAVALAMQSISMANPMGAQSLFQDALDRLPPKAQEAIRAVEGLREEITVFQRGLGDVMFDGVAERITGAFTKLAPTIMPGMEAIAVGLNQNILAVFNALESDDGRSIIERLLGGTAEAQKALSGVIDPVVRGLGTLIAAGAEHLPQFVNLIGQLAERFALFIEKADKSGALDKFMDDGITAFKNLMEIGVNLVKIINDFSNGFRGAFGSDILTSLAKVTEKWHQFLSSAEGQKKINEYINEAKELWKKWQPILSDLPGIFEKISNVAMGFLKAFLPVLNTVSSALEKMPWLVEAFAAVWIGGKMASAGMAIFKFGQLVVGIGKGVGGLAGSIVGMMKSIGPYLPVIGQWLASKGIGLGGGLPPFLPGDTATPGAAAGGAGGAADKPGAKPKPTTKLGKVGSALGKVGSIIGKVFTPLAVGLMGYDIYQNTKASNDAWDQWQEARKAAKDDAQRREIDKEIYASLGIDIPASGKYPILGKNDFQGFANPMESMAPLYENGFEIKDGKIVQKGTGEPMYLMDSYAKGGLTPWAKNKGKAAVLHGQEFVMPADAVDFYGQDFMESIRKRKMPPLGFSGGGEVYDPMTGQWVPAPAEQPHGQNPAAPMVPGLLGDTMAGVNGVLDNTGQNPLGGPLGPAPGPLLPPTSVFDPNTPPTGTPTGTVPLTTNVLGQDVQLGSFPAGWPGGQAPVGLGGGADGWDMRKEWGIGPGPAGSTPSDWAKWGTDFTAGLVTNLGGALLRGFLGIFGLEGALSNPYLQNALGLGMHFLGGDKSKAQAPGAADANAYANNLLNVYGQMPMNPAYPGVPGGIPANMQGLFPGYGQQFMPGMPMMAPGIGMPGLPGMPGYIPGGTELGVGNAAGSEAGLQRDTIAGRRAISAAFPMLREIGGVRADKLKWHPNGLAIDAMIPPEMVGTKQGSALGGTVTQFALQNASALGVNHVIWEGKMYYPDGRVEQMTLTGDKTQDHFDHPHIAFNGAGMPDKNTKYVAPPNGIVQYGFDRNGFPVAMMGGMMPGMLPGYTGLGGTTSYTPTDSPVAPSDIPSLGIRSGAVDYTMGKIGVMAGGPTPPQPPKPPKNMTPEERAKERYLARGLPASEWPAFWELLNDKAAMDFLNKNLPWDRAKPGEDASALGWWVVNKYKKSPIKALNEWRAKREFGRGGAVWGAGSATSDSIPAYLSNGEHVLTADEVKKLGGQDKVYALRNAIRNGNPMGLEGGGDPVTLADLLSGGNPAVMPPLKGSGSGLTPQMELIKQRMTAKFPWAATQGWREPDRTAFGNFNEHSAGRAFDMYVPSELRGTPLGQMMGDAITKEFLANGAEYAIWQQKEWHPGQAPMQMENRANGNQTANHFDHSHGYDNAMGPSVLESEPRVPMPPLIPAKGWWDTTPGAPGFAWGGAVQGVVVPKPPPIPPRPPMFPPPNTAQPKQIPAQKKIEPQPVPAAPKPSPIEQMPAGGGQAPMPSPAMPPMPEVQPPDTTQGPQGSATTNQPSAEIMNPGPGADSYMHLHPAARKGIASGMAVAGSLAQMAVMAGTMGAGGAGMAAGIGMGAMGGMGGGGGGGGMGLPTGVSVQGLFQQGGKIMENAANIGASFLVGNITGGTTENPYGVTQMPNKPSGGTKIYDASTSIGSIHTADLDEYYRRENRRQAQRAQSGLGQWGSR